MRTVVAAAVACLSVVGLSVAADVQASIKKDIAIPAGGLGPALRVLSEERRIHVIFISEDVNTLLTQGASGSLTIDEALNQLLNGTGLTFKYIDDETVSIVPVATPPAATRASDKPTGKSVGSGASAFAEGLAADEAGGGSRGFWQRFRVAQAETGLPSEEQSSVRPNESFSATDTIQEIIVTAQKREERLQDVPISISVLSGDDLDRSTDRGVAEALNRVPGVVNMPFANERFGGNSPLILRGVASAPSAGASTTAYYLDSIPFGFTRRDTVPDASAYDLQRVEVLRGPQGTLYGANALNGVVRVLTRDADLNDFQLKVRTSIAGMEDGDNTYRGDLAVNAPIVEGKLAARAVLGYQDIGGWIDRAFEQDANTREVRNARLKVNAQPSDQFSVGLSAWLSRTEGTPSHSPDNRTSASLVDERATNDYDAYGINLGYDFSAFSLASMTSYIDFTNESDIDVAALGPGLGTIRSIFASEVFAQEVNLASTHPGPWRWTLGGIYRDSEDLSWQLRSVGYLAPAAVITFSESFAVFGEITRVFADGLFELTGGVRYFEDRMKDAERSFLSAVGGIPPGGLTTAISKFDDIAPRGVLSWHPSERMSLYASYGEGFRSGLNQLPATTRQAPEFPPADPDELKNYEIGAKGSFWDGRINFDSAVFYVDWQDVQQGYSVLLIANPPIFGSAIVNAGSASGPGFEFNTSIELIDGLTLGANIGWNDLKVDHDVRNVNGTIVLAEGDRLARSAETTVGASADYAFRLGGAGWEGRLSASANYLSSLVLQRTSAGAVVRGSTLLSRASFAIASPSRWTTSIFADNLGNEKGFARDPNSPQWNTYFQPRTIGLQVEYQFD